MGELKRFSANIPLIYNKEDIHNYKEDSEFICGLTNNIVWSQTYDVCEKIEDGTGTILSCQEEMKYILSCGMQKENSHIPEDAFSLCVENVVAHNSEEAESILMPVLHNVCRVLSFQMNVQNCNKQGYQPRVQTDYKNIDWSQSVYEPYEEIMAESDEVDEYIDENGKKIQVIRFKSPKIVIKTAIHISMFTNLNEKEVIGLLHVSMDEKLDYMLEEYYVALGVEMITSKFYHLFTIVELIEQEYIGLSNSYHLFSKEEINQVIERIENSVEDLKQCYVKDAVRNQMSKITNIGRVDKLVNILREMGITEITNCGRPFEVNRQTIEQLIDLRNRCFHGGYRHRKDFKAMPMEDAVPMLLEVCQRAIQYRLEGTVSYGERYL